MTTYTTREELIRAMDGFATAQTNADGTECLESHARANQVVATYCVAEQLAGVREELKMLRLTLGRK